MIGVTALVPATPTELGGTTISYFLEFWKVFIPTIALVLSIMSLWKSRRSLIIRFDPNIVHFNEFYLSHEDMHNNVNSVLSPNCFAMSFTCVNTSPTDIGFFDVQIIGLDSEDRFVAKLNAAGPPPEHEGKGYYLSINHGNKYWNLKKRLNKLGGVFTAQNCEIFHVVTRIPQEFYGIEKICIGFNIPKFSLRKQFPYNKHLNKNNTVREHYRSYWKIYDIRRDKI